MNDLEAISHYLGMKIIRTNLFSYKMRQKQYVENVLIKFSLQDAKNSKYPSELSYGKNESELLPRNDEYQSFLGSMLYISVNTCSDISTSVSILARKTSNPSCEDWNELKGIAKYLKGTSEMYLNLR